MRNSGGVPRSRGKKEGEREGKKHTFEYPSEFVLVASHI